MKPRYIPTISSFYTVAFDRRKEEESIPPVPPLPKPHAADPSSVTPYLCLQSSLTQIAFNRLTLVFVFAALYVHAFSSAVQWALSSTESSVLSVCAASTASVDTGLPLASVVVNATESALLSAIDAIDSSAQHTLSTTVNSIADSAVDYITQVQSLYELVGATSKDQYSFSSVVQSALASIHAQQKPAFQESTNFDLFVNRSSSTSATIAGACPSEAQIIAYFTDLVNSVQTLKNNCLALLIVFALLCYFPATLNTWYHWRSTRHQAKLLQNLEFADALDNIDMARNPAVTWLGLQITKRFFSSHNDRSSNRVRWTINYILSPTMLFLLGTGLIFSLVSLCQSAIVAPIFQSPNNSFTTLESFSNLSSSALFKWASQCNSALVKAETSINENHVKNINDYTQFMSNTIDVFIRSMDDQLKKIGASLVSPNVSSFDTHVKLTNITYPQVNTTVLPTEQSIYQQTTHGALAALCEALDSVVTAHMQIGVAFLSFWLGVSIAAAAYSIYQYKRS
ncbi:hypothetical protein TRVA0_013S02432 [Trichomonascus vanleenenianus]|uniref:uncharacterized protein n=1 Tax=Trichomonascus vanleenenianus TaxID=2268995 RepID=UPI003ECA4A96